VAGIIEEASRNGLPALRSMRLAFPRDMTAGAHYAHQFLLGPSLLVAPVLHNNAETTVWLPAGEKWYHLPTGTKFEGGQAITIPVSADGIAVFGRGGHVLCIGPDVAGAPSINTIKPVTDAWLFGLPNMDPCVTGIRVKVMQMQGNAYIKGLEGTKVISTEDYTVSRRGAEVKVVKRR
jgi:alpha-D-xyloside xylohydrolase